jgi:hypothetical protein
MLASIEPKSTKRHASSWAKVAQDMLVRSGMSNVLAVTIAPGREPQCIHRHRALDLGAAGDGGRCIALPSPTPVIVGTKRA